MKIKKIEKKKNGKYEIILENNEKVKTYDEVILNNNILFHKELDDDTRVKIDGESYYYDVYNKIIKMISVRLRCEEEIKDFLKKCDLNDKEKDKIILSLKQNGLINDESFARAYIHDKVNFSNLGPLKIKSELEKYNIDNNIIINSMKDIDDTVFDEKVKKYVLKKVKNNHKYSKSMLAKKIKNELYLMGYNDINIDEYIMEDELILEKEMLKEYEKLKVKCSSSDIKNKIYRKFYQKGFSYDIITKCLEKLEI